MRHIDSTGIERVLTEGNYNYGKHSKDLYKRGTREDVIKALNSIRYVGHDKKYGEPIVKDGKILKDENKILLTKRYYNAVSDNGWFFTFNGDEVVSFRHIGSGLSKSYLEKYLRDRTIDNTVEVVKWQIGFFK